MAVTDVEVLCGNSPSMAGVWLASSKTRIPADPVRVPIERRANGVQIVRGLGHSPETALPRLQRIAAGSGSH